MRGKCPKCDFNGKLTGHHCLPKRFFKNVEGINKLYLCRKCHDDLELMIPAKRKRTPAWYFKVIKHFLGEDSYEAIKHPSWEVCI